MDMVDTERNLRENKAAHRFIATNDNDWSGWECYAGVEQIIVDFDGSVWRGWCRVGGKVGWIHDPSQIQFPTEPILCNKTYCHCNFDIMSTKVLPNSIPLISI